MAKQIDPFVLDIQGQKKGSSLVITHPPLARALLRLSAAKAYHLRWQVALLFEEWKSYANLHAFDTQNPAITWLTAKATVSVTIYLSPTVTLGDQDGYS